MLSRLLQPHHLTLPHPLSLASLDTFGNEIAESPVAHRLLQHQLQVHVKVIDASALVVHLELLLLLLLHRSRMGSRPAAWGSKDGRRSSFVVCFRP